MMKIVFTRPNDPSWKMEKVTFEIPEDNTIEDCIPHMPDALSMAEKLGTTHWQFVFPAKIDWHRICGR